MLKFYDVDEKYVQYLKQKEKQIPDIKYDKNNKFICGVVLVINDINYYAPISSNTQIQRTNLPIYDKHNKVIATIRFCFMFPAPIEVLQEKDFSLINQTNSSYADLLGTEYRYCISNEDKILKKANAVYEIGCNKNHKFNYTCCDFKLLEQLYIDYRNKLIADKDLKTAVKIAQEIISKHDVEKIG